MVQFACRLVLDWAFGELALERRGRRVDLGLWGLLREERRAVELG
jgi:hypothetical protein